MFALAPDFAGYNSYVALIDAAWKALVDHDPADLNFRQLSLSAGVSPSLASRHFKTKGELFAAVAGAGLTTLWNNIEDAEDLPHFVIAWLKFAAHRPRHHQLMFSSEYIRHSRVEVHLSHLTKRLAAHLERPLKRWPTDAEVDAVFAMIQGCAFALISLGDERPIADLYGAIVAYLNRQAISSASRSIR